MIADHDEKREFHGIFTLIYWPQHTEEPSIIRYKVVDMNSSMWARETFNPKSSSKLCDPEVGGQVSTEWQVWLVTDYINKSDPTPQQGHHTHKSTWCGASSVGELSPLSSLILNASTWKPTLSISDESGKYRSVQFGVKYLELKESLLHVSV